MIVIAKKSTSRAGYFVVELSRYAAEKGRVQCFPHRAFFLERQFNQQIKAYKIIGKKLPIYDEGFFANYFAAYLNVELSRYAAEEGRPQCFPHRAFFHELPSNQQIKAYKIIGKKLPISDEGFFVDYFAAYLNV